MKSSLLSLPEAAPPDEDAAFFPSLLTRTMQTARALPRCTVISVVPFFKPVTTPEALTEARDGSLLVYVAVPLPLRTDA